MRFCLTLLLSVLLLAPGQPEKLGAQEGTVFFLVRHAERADDGPADPAMVTDPHLAQDPPLSEGGQARARLLASMLRDAGLTHIHSTSYRRTLETAAPTAEATGLTVEPYDASDLEAFSRRLRETPGRHLIVGHSNTTPALVRALGGDPGEPIEPLEYDRLYVLTLEGDAVLTVLLRFGEG